MSKGAILWSRDVMRLIHVPAGDCQGQGLQPCELPGLPRQVVENDNARIGVQGFPKSANTCGVGMG